MPINTRDRIVETGAAIIHHKGFNHTGIQEILTAAGVPKGSFYNYFKSKERGDEETPDELLAELDELRGRIEVLEKIVTDDRYHLNKELDKLERQA